MVNASDTLETSDAVEARRRAAWRALESVPDPEVPALSVCDLGLVRELIVRAGHEGVDVVLTPTYSGCPATEVIAQSVREAIDAAGLGPARTTQRLAPAWTTDWISEAGRRKLLEAGIAPPHLVDAAQQDVAPIRLRPRGVDCPRCTSQQTERLSAFGSTACKSLYRCLSCREPFEYFKPL